MPSGVSNANYSWLKGTKWSSTETNLARFQPATEEHLSDQIRAISDAYIFDNQVGWLLRNMFG